MQYPKINYVQPLPNYQLFLIFDNGAIKIFDSKTLWKNPVFSALKDEKIFSRVSKGQGGYGVVWNDDLDLSEALLWEQSRAIDTIQRLAESIG